MFFVGTLFDQSAISTANMRDMLTRIFQHVTMWLVAQPQDSEVNTMFQKLDTSSIKDRALHALEEKLLSGEFKPGDKLPPERDIAEEMGVSRSIISMCMIDLEAEGFVKSVPRQGTFAMDYIKNGTPAILSALMNCNSERLDIGLFKSMMATRIHIECECARLAAQNATESDIDELEQTIEKMRLYACDDEFLKLDFEFHHCISAASGNAVYAMIVKSFESAILFFEKQVYVSAKPRNNSIELHSALLDAVRERDSDRASSIMRDILNFGIGILEEIYDKNI